MLQKTQRKVLLWIVSSMWERMYWARLSSTEEAATSFTVPMFWPFRMTLTSPSTSPEVTGAVTISPRCRE